MTDNTRHDWDTLDERLDQAIDALNAERGPVLVQGDSPVLVELVDTARIIRRLRESGEPDDDFPDRLVAAVVTNAMTGDGQVLNPDGRLEAVRQPAESFQRRGRLLLAQLAALLRVVGISVLAGTLAGTIVGGLGGRAAMRISGYLYERGHPGQVAITESSGEPVGQISLEGTLGLIVETGLLGGMVGGLLYLLVAPWLPRSRRVSGLAFAGVLLAIAGAAVITGDNHDFQRIGSPLLNVIMFAALIATYGVSVVVLAARLERMCTIEWGGSAQGIAVSGIWFATLVAGLGGVIAATLLSMSLLIEAVSAVASRDAPPVTATLLVIPLFVVLPLARIALVRPNGRIATRLGGLERVRLLALLALGLAMATTLAQLVTSISFILSGS